MQTKSIQYHPEIFNVNFKITESIDLPEGAYTKKSIKIKIFAKEEILIYTDVNMFSTVI